MARTWKSYLNGLRSVASDELNTNAIRFALGTLADGQFRQTLSDGDAMLLKSSMNALTVYSTGSNGGSNLFQKYFKFRW